MKLHLARVIAGQRLSEVEASEVMGVIMDGAATPAQIGALLAALALRGETEDEVVGFARTMRSRAVPLSARGAIDTCGTGGDGVSTFNISTLASLAVAACGVTVAKHGNRSSSGRCGSADVLEALGLRLDPPAATVQRSLDEIGWAFLFAPGFHASTRHAVAPRKELGIRTAFNLLGPLTNPAQPETQVVGVPRPELTVFLARCLRRLGVKRGWVVHGAGLDEVSLSGATLVAAFDEEHESVRTFEVHPREAGLDPAAPEALAGGTPEECATIARDVLGGAPGPRRDAVVLNAAAALVAAGRAAHLREAAAQASEALDDGRARRVLDRAREASHS
jgi:anthranilate phosphoribosyltransferase